MPRVVLNPVTRIEGHGVAEVFLDAAGQVAGARLAVAELRGFEHICVGRPVEEMPRLTSRICGMCPAAHHVAAAKALDDLWEVEPSPAAQQIRELALCGQMVQSHLTHFYAMALPDLLGHNRPPAERNFIGILQELGPDLARYILNSRAHAGQLLALLGGKGIHADLALPGGVARAYGPEEMHRAEALARSMVSFARFSLDLFQERVVAGMKGITVRELEARDTYYLAMQAEGFPSFTGGELVLMDSMGRELDRFGEGSFPERLTARREAWSYAEVFYLNGPGGEPLTVEVGPLARLHANRGFPTPLAGEAYTLMMGELGSSRPLGGIPLVKHWARLVEALYAAERALELAHYYRQTALPPYPQLPTDRRGSGLGVVEAPRGLLFHRYQTDDHGLVTDARIITPTAVNQAAIGRVMTIAAREALARGGGEAGLAAGVEGALRAFDPCLSCASHVLGGPQALVRLVQWKRVAPTGWHGDGGVIDDQHKGPGTRG